MAKIISIDEGQKVLRGDLAVEARWTRLVERWPAIEAQRFRREQEREERRRAERDRVLEPWMERPSDGR